MIALAVLLTALALASAALWPGGHSAEATPDLNVGIDMDPATTTDIDPVDGVYETNPSASILEGCRDVTVNEEFTIDIFVLDVEALVAFSADFLYDGAKIEVIGSFTGTIPSNPNGTLFLSAQPGSEVTNASQNDPDPMTGELLIPDTNGLYEAAAVDTGNVGGDTSSGILARLTLKAVAAGVSPAELVYIDLNGDGTLDMGVTLRDAGGAVLNDIDPVDGFYDGPFTNRESLIAIDQPDSDGDGISDPCDPDIDGDGVPNDGDTSGVAGDNPCTGGATTNCDDNCPTIFNPPQEDENGDGIGDACAGDVDGDGYWDDKETSWGSDPTDTLSTPEVCDLADNDGDLEVDEGYDYSRPGGGPPNGVPDCSEDVDSDGDGSVNPADDDDDDDVYLDEKENWMATDSLKDCAPVKDGTHDAWAPDLDNSRVVNIFDVLRFKLHIMTELGGPDYNRRFDLNANSKVDIFDVLLIKPDFFGECTP